jgi:hypothetical protein
VYVNGAELSIIEETLMRCSKIPGIAQQGIDRSRATSQGALLAPRKHVSLTRTLHTNGLILPLGSTDVFEHMVSIIHLHWIVNFHAQVEIAL